MKIVANKDKKTKKRFPWKVILDNGRIIPVPSQHNFKTDFLSSDMVVALSLLYGFTL